MGTNGIETKVEVNSTNVEAVIVDRSADTVSAFAELTPGQQRGYAEELWRLGLMATRYAQRRAEESRIADIGTALHEDLTSALNIVVRQQQEQVGRELARYFDPESGELSRRLRSFLEGDGELARVMAGFLAPETGVLAQTLARQIGESSPLLKKLSPTDAEGVVQSLRAQLVLALKESHAELARVMDPLNPSSPVSRFLTTLQGGLKQQEGALGKQMEVALRALDANDPASPLSNLVRQSTEASQVLVKAMNVADTASPLAQLKHSVTELLKAQHQQSVDFLREEALRREIFEKQVLATVTKLETQRASNRNTPRGGVDFEAATAAAVRELLGRGPFLFTHTGNVTGIRLACKVGDFTVRFTDESKWAGARVVFECKHQERYQVEEALRELDVARENREAQAGVFVMANSHAHPDFPEFARHGNNILVNWDPEDERSLSRLEAAVMLALALATRKPERHDDAGRDGVKDIERSLGAELERVEKMRKASDGIRKHNDGLRKELDKAEAELKELIARARETVRALSPTDDEVAEREEPIAFRKSTTSAA
jgi:hypothetical protein